MKQVERKSVRGGEDADSRNGSEEAVGEVIERVKRDPELTEHEQRLLGYYTTPSLIELLVSFVCTPFEPTRGNIRWCLWASAQPSHPIDSIQSIVSPCSPTHKHSAVVSPKGTGLPEPYYADLRRHGKRWP